MVDFPGFANIIDAFLVDNGNRQYRASLLAGPAESLGNLSMIVTHLNALRVPPSKIIPAFGWSV